MAVKRVPGVLSAEFSYEKSEGSVTFDPSQTSPETFIAELTRLTGYTARVREPGDGGR